jgi:hypothetical protein
MCMFMAIKVSQVQSEQSGSGSCNSKTAIIFECRRVVIFIYINFGVFGLSLENTPIYMLS